MTSRKLEDEVLDAVTAAILSVMSDRHLEARDVTAECSIVDDLGLDSLRFIDLTVELERALGIAEFPMQAWVDEQVRLGSAGFRVRALLERCVQLRLLDFAFSG